MDKNKCLACSRKLSWIGLWDSLFLAIFKGLIGIFTHSRALVASALYSVHDVISSIAILIGLKVASKPHDEEHPYGHGNIEYIVSVFTSLLILGGTIFILYDCIKMIFGGEHYPPHWAAFGAAVVSAFTNELIYRYNICAVKHTNSPAIYTHAQHHRADAISSVAVIIAILGGKLGFYFLDAFVAVFEAAHLIHLSTKILYHGSIDLLDRSVDPGIVKSIREIVSLHPDVKEVKDIRTRQVGRVFWVDVSIELPVNILITEAENISNQIKKVLMEKVQHIGNVNVIYG